MADEPHKLGYTTDPAAPHSPEERAWRLEERDIARYRAMLRSSVGAGDHASDQAPFMEIGGVGVMRKAWRVSLWVAVLAGVLSVFVYLFYHFTNDLRIALVVVTAMLLYMLAASALAEGRLEE